MLALASWSKPSPQAATEPIRVVCENCGGTSTIAIVALALSGIGVVISAIAFFLVIRDRRKRADFKLEVTFLATRTTTFDAGDGNSVRPIIVFGIDNTGKKASTDVLLEFLVPSKLVEDVFWSDERGLRDQDLPGPVELPEEIDGNGPSLWINRVARRISLRSSHVAYVTAPLTFDYEADSLAIPVRVKAQSDDLPDRIEEVVFDEVLTLVRPR